MTLVNKGREAVLRISNFLNCNVCKSVDSDEAQNGSVVAEGLRASSSNSGVSDQQSVGSNPQP